MSNKTNPLEPAKVNKAYRIYKAAKKELPGTGPFIKIYGQTGRSRKEIKAHIESFRENDEISLAFQ